MKFANVILWLMVGALTVLITACNTGVAAMESQIIVVTATPTATLKAVVDDPAPTAEVQVGGGAEPKAEPTAVIFKPGTLLKGSGDGVFYLRDDGTRQHIHNWSTFLEFGFAKKDIVDVEEAELDTYPLIGELTQLVRDDKGNLYWIVQGQIWKVNEWNRVVGQPSYTGVPVTPLDDSLKAKLWGFKPLSDGTLLRQDDTVYYFDYAGYGRGTLILVPEGVYRESDVIDVPVGVLAVYAVQPYVEKAYTSLNRQTEAANVRAANNLEAEILGVIQSGRRIPVQARTADGAWLVVSYQDQLGWLSADLVESTLELSLLPLDTQLAELKKDVPEAQPAAIIEAAAPTELQPIYCDTAPIRGFGKVWGDHLDVQNTLGCPWGAEAGTDAAVQHFQHGIMLWLGSDSRYNADPVYVFFDDGNYQRFGDLGAADPAKVGEIPAGFYPVGDKFSKVYWEGTGVKVKERLGYATSEAEDTAGAFLQFDRGRMFWAEAVDSIFVIYDYYECCDANDNSSRIRSWASYEDKF